MRSGVPPTAVAPAKAPLSYTPRHLAEKILTSRSALEGERKQVTVLFADVKGSMDLAEQLDPEACYALSAMFTDADLAPLLEPLGSPGAEAARFNSLVKAANAAAAGEPLDEIHLR